MQLTQERDKIFPQPNKAEHHKVTFRSRYGITLVGDLYVPKNVRPGQELPAIAVVGAFGAVREQSSGLYAQEMAERGFVILALDPSCLGESGGESRNMVSPDINTKDFSITVNFLGLQNFANREQIGILGICGWGGTAPNAAVGDTCVKAIATSTMYDMTHVMANGYEVNMRQDTQGDYDRTQPQTAEARYQVEVQLNNGRWEVTQNGYTTLSPASNLDPKDITAGAPKFIVEYTDFYHAKRGSRPHAVSSSPQGFWVTTAPLAPINMPILQRAGELRAPASVVHGERAHSCYLSEDAFKSLGSENKELYTVPGANRTDLYDNIRGEILFDKLSGSLKQTCIRVA